MNKTIKTVLAGNPNCGKSTVFNKLTGARQTIGNFPGVTVDRYEGRIQYQNLEIILTDLPGIYSLSAFSDEEQAAVDFLDREDPDLIINIVDASRLERNLYLTLLLKDLGKPMLVVLNMIDAAEKQGIEIDLSALSRELGVPVLTAAANRGIGIPAILDEIVRAAGQIDNNSAPACFPINKICSEHNCGEFETANNYSEQNRSRSDAEVFPVSQSDRTEQDDINSESANDLLSIKAKFDKESAAGRRRFKPTCRSSCSSCVCGNKCSQCLKRTGGQTAVDTARYKQISRICVHCVRSAISLEPNRSDWADHILMNKYLGIPIFLLIMYSVFQLTFTLGQYPMDWIEKGFELLTGFLAQFWPDGNASFLKSLILEGILGGVGGVLVFLPNILILFLAISVLEDSGYLARAALLSDRWMYKIGLQGKSVVPMLIGFGCTVPALMAARMLSSRRERLATMFVLPLFSCGARFPIYALIIPAFFPLQWRGPILWLIYFTGILLAIVFAKLITSFFKGSEEPLFIIELPPYHRPTFRTVGTRTLERGWQYLKKAGTVILAISIVLWFLTNYPDLSPEIKQRFNDQRKSAVERNNGLPALANSGSALEIKLAEIDRQEKQLRMTGSFAGRLGRLMEPILKPMGFDWKIGTALIGAAAAKEIFIAQLGIVYSVDINSGHQEEIGQNGRQETPSASLADILKQNYNPMTGLHIMLFCLIASPCIATFSTMAKETGSWKWAAAQWIFLTVVAWLLVVISNTLTTGG